VEDWHTCIHEAAQLKRRSGLKQYKEVKKIYRGAGKSLARQGRKQSTATEDFDVHISYLQPLLLLLVFSPWASLGRNQSTVR
jgi:hypothetical protein